ncbi:protein of unknown function [Candidatus Nitrospira inopinata]|uniref:Uncharacterized protein n=1 Tax=Candidatus Nitrospira inopinata TaxID=1715989 RepID=A0A0S4KRC5_9BACT|nr:protein of unknown function [Candidatus Nitrospira inopinata]
MFLEGWQSALFCFNMFCDQALKSRMALFLPRGSTHKEGGQ